MKKTNFYKYEAGDYVYLINNCVSVSKNPESNGIFRIISRHYFGKYPGYDAKNINTGKIIYNIDEVDIFRRVPQTVLERRGLKRRKVPLKPKALPKPPEQPAQPKEYDLHHLFKLPEGTIFSNPVNSLLYKVNDGTILYKSVLDADDNWKPCHTIRQFGYRKVITEEPRSDGNQNP